METPASLDRATLEAIAQSVRQSVRRELIEAGLAAPGDVEMAGRWDGGEIVIKPGRDGRQEKSVPIDAFFHKLVLARERLRVLEQKINNHPKLNDAERIELQEYITRIYGSFTTFNFLFDNRLDGFLGQGER